jgi:type I restriction enzyme S subunit
MKPGYKQTEVGVIPEEWSIRPLGLICDVRDGTHESPRFFKDGIPFVTSKNIVDGRLDLENVSFISKSDAVEFDKRSKVDRNDILLSMIGTIGSAVLVDCDPAFCIKNVALIKPRKVAPTYLIRLINAPVFQKYLADNLDGGIQKFISLGKLRQLFIPLPDEAEQRAIAAVLSDVDGLLGALDRLIAKKRDLKQAAMQQLLTGQTRLPGFKGEWVVKTLGDIASVKDGTHQTPRYVSSGVPFYSVEHVTSGDFKNTKFISKEEHRFLTRSFKMEKGDILMTRIGSIGDCKLIDWEVDASFYVSLALLKINHSYSASYIAHYSKSATFQKEVELHSLQSAIPKKINLGPISEVKIELPPLPEQTAIASILSEMDAELAALEQRREKTRALKQGMMQELLTGRTRLV